GGGGGGGGGKQSVWFIAVVLFAGWSAGLKIATGPTSVEKAVGDSARLECTFKLDAGDFGPLDIEWSQTPPDPTTTEQIIIYYSADRVFDDNLPPEMRGRVHFSSTDPKTGDGSLNFTNLKPSDNALYHCKIKKAPGLGSKKIKLDVLAKPSIPRCHVDTSQEVGKDVAMKCSSEEGTAPISYTWSKLGHGQSLPPKATSGVCVSVYTKRKHLQAYGGEYIKITQSVGSGLCRALVRLHPASNTAGKIAGAIIGVILALLIIAIIVWCILRKRKEKKFEKEVSHEIREDVPPPKSRVSTARSYTVDSHRSSLGSMSPSNMEVYKPHYDRLATEDMERPPSHSPSHNPSRNPSLNPNLLAGYKVAVPSLNRMGAIPVMIPAQNRDGYIV
uniref:CXADR Ig-like cell adhesion molecule n=1 Tax=Callorhinchus milii TaxID=7868 RepID=A0A4W3GHP2_CALMI